jgi:hypothetical protein
MTFDPERENDIFLQNVGNNLQDHAASQSRSRLAKLHDIRSIFSFTSDPTNISSIALFCLHQPATILGEVIVVIYLNYLRNL